MACKNAYKVTINNEAPKAASPQTAAKSAAAPTAATKKKADRLLFGADSKMQADDLLQNNIDQFEWVVRNKIYPNFYGRYLTGENCLTREEIKYLHGKGCRIAAIYAGDGEKQTEEQGAALAEVAAARATELGIPAGTAIFLELGENEKANRNFMRGYAKALMDAGYTPGFKANTDAKYLFDREYSRGMQSDREVFEKCLIWAVSPALSEYNGMTTTHLIHPDRWKPYAPSGITRREIAIWQYGRDCHPIEDDNGNMTTFNLNLVRDAQVIIKKMF